MGCESGATLGTDLDDLLAFEHLGHHVPQFLQVTQNGAVGCNMLLGISCGPG